MTSTDSQLQSDPLLRLRQSIASNSPAIPSTSEDANSASDVNLNLAIATHLHFSEPDRQAFPLTTPTRFRSSDKPVDLRSIYFAWQKKDVAIPDYIASAQRLNEELSAAGGAGGQVQNLVFVERLDLITWLEGASEESEYITALDSEGASAAADGSAQVASGVAGGVPSVPSDGTSGAPGVTGANISGAGIGRLASKKIDPRLAEIYNGERRMGDRNRVLRGVKQTDFSHVRKLAETFLQRSRGSASRTASNIPSNPALASHSRRAAPTRRPDPIILLSPSESSLLRMSNIKSFLEVGTYIPADAAGAALGGSSSSANILHIQRLIPSIDPTRPIRFILVDTPEQFRPDYWNRVVAVFTTGQTWQFKGYKWQDAPELFRNVLGVFVGWRGETVPPTVKGWGRGVIATQVDKWNPQLGTDGRWRDREVVEGIWGAVEEGMKSRGWGRAHGPTPR